MERGLVVHDTCWRGKERSLTGAELGLVTSHTLRYRELLPSAKQRGQPDRFCDFPKYF